MENHWIYYEELKKITVGKPLNILWRDKNRYHWIYLENHWIYYEELKNISVGKPLNILWRVKKDYCWKTTEYIMKS